MKKAFIYIILFAYSLMLARPAVPFIADVIAHTFWYSQHIATVHFENGKYHVHYQYMNEAQKNSPGKTTHYLKTETPVTEHIFSSDRFDFEFYFITKLEFPDPASQLNEVFLQHNLPPPKISFLS